MICPICKISLYKTEKCNGLSHHNIERCYACGRIGYKIKGLGEHWSYNGYNGCYRFDTDTYVRENLENYKCLDSVCSNHDIGDCSDPTHQQGIEEMFKSRKKAYIYHGLMSLLTSIRYDVYDELYDKFKNDKELMDLLPYKQTLKILEIKKERIKDYTEDIVYEYLKLKHPKEIDVYIDKILYINYEDYLFLYAKELKEETNDQTIEQLINEQVAPLLPIINEEIQRNINIGNQINNIENRLNELNNIFSNIINNDETHDEQVDMTDLLPPPPIYLQRQLYYQEDDVMSDDSFNETRQLIPINALSSSNFDVIGRAITTPSIADTPDTSNTPSNEGYMLLDEILDRINDDYNEDENDYS
jgi:hypothetical protein